MRLASAPLRNHPLSASFDSRKRPHVDLESAGLIGLIRDPMAIGREFSAGLTEIGAQERSRLALTRCAVHGQHPQVSFGLRIDIGVQQVASIARPVAYKFLMIGLED